MIPVIVVLIAAVLGAIAQLFCKKASGKGLFGMLKDYNIYIGGFLYALSAVMFIVTLRYEKLMLLYPLISTSYIWTSLLAMKYLKEKMNQYKWLGIVLIMVGVLFIVK